MTWQPIETAPPPCDDPHVIEAVLVYVPVHGIGTTAIAYHTGDGWFPIFADDKLDKPTHWMPLPEPPA